MEMCYQGTLAMPKSYAVMDQDEMMYVEGGFYINKNKCATMATYISMLVGVSKAALAVMALGALAAKIGQKAIPIVNKLTGLSVTAKVIGIALTAIAVIELASFCNGIITADRKNKGVSMKWKGVFTNKTYY